MATNTDSRTSADGEYEQAFPDWVYQAPGVALIVGGFGGIVLLTLV